MRRRTPFGLALVVLGCVFAAQLAWLSWMGASQARIAATEALESDAPPPCLAHASPAPDAGPESRSEAAPTDAERTDEPMPQERSSIPEPPHEPACTIEVLGPDGRPRAYCRIVAMVGGAFAWSGGTDERGLMFDARPASEPVDLLVDACTCLHRQPGVVLEDHGHVRITLPEGLAIEGRISFDGGPPVAGEQLTIDLRRTNSPAGLKTLPAPARWSIEHHELAGRLHAPVAADGTFRIAGLEPGFTGCVALRPIERVTLVDPTRPGASLLTVPVVAGKRDVVLHARRFPVLSGSMGEASGGWARVTIVATLPDSTRVSRWSGPDRGSRFEIPLDFRTPSSVNLTIMDRAGKLARTVDLPGPFDGDLDVGTLDPPSVGGQPVPRDEERARREAEEDAAHQRTLLALESRDSKMTEKTVHGTVVDEAGAPIEGARVWSPNAARSGETDAQGTFELGDWLPERVDVEITARGRQPVVVRDLDVAALDGRTFVLKRGHAVRLTVVDSRGDPFVRPGHVGRCDHGWEVWSTALGSNRHDWPDDGVAWGEARPIGGHPWSPAGPGIYDFLELPEGPVTFHVEGVEGPVWTLEHDSSVPEARIVVPAHGSIRLDLDLRLDDRPILVHLVPVTTGGTALDFRGDWGLTYYGTLLLPAVLPGDYVVRVDTPLDPETRTWRSFGPEHRITVRAGETTVLSLER